MIKYTFDILTRLLSEFFDINVDLEEKTEDMHTQICSIRMRHCNIFNSQTHIRKKSVITENELLNINTIFDIKFSQKRKGVKFNFIFACHGLSFIPSLQVFSPLI